MTKFQDVPTQQYFKLQEGGPSFLKTSAFGYWLDPVMGEMQVQGALEVIYPIVVPQPQAAQKAANAKVRQAAKARAKKGK